MSAPIHLSPFARVVGFSFRSTKLTGTISAVDRKNSTCTVVDLRFAADSKPFDHPSGSYGYSHNGDSMGKMFAVNDSVFLDFNNSNVRTVTGFNQTIPADRQDVVVAPTRELYEFMTVQTHADLQHYRSTGNFYHGIIDHQLQLNPAYFSYEEAFPSGRYTWHFDYMLNVSLLLSIKVVGAYFMFEGTRCVNTTPYQAFVLGPYPAKGYHWTTVSFFKVYPSFEPAEWFEFSSGGSGPVRNFPDFPGCADGEFPPITVHYPEPPDINPWDTQPDLAWNTALRQQLSFMGYPVS
ncbi:MAG: hypothetical protein ABT940_11685 [Alphaproteobacteria bacterium]